MSKTVLITGGGTGGHLSVAKSFIEEFYERGYTVIYIGSTKGQDKQWFENEPKLAQKYFLETKGVVNQNFLGKFASLWMILKAVLKSRKIIKQNNIKKVISVGGFSAASGGFASIISGCELYIHEQNSVMGKLNQITSKFAKEIFCSYMESSKVKDYPINKKFFEHSRIRTNVKSVIFLGGSQGAKAINDFAISIAPTLINMGIDVIHQAGKNDIDRVTKEYEKLELKVDVFGFSTKLLEKMDKADFAISRAGASTLWELVALGIPTLFIPFPYAAANHQYFNAKYLLDNDLCFLQKQDELKKEYLIDAINSDIEVKSKSLIELIHKDAIKNIVDIIED
jgi:UDP-N-acetylglucosamine--N-acetylmuramyl-(pentapeptide) pyrophosphoryl-undecaprenol N-acetylglucosamine transferase